MYRQEGCIESPQDIRDYQLSEKKIPVDKNSLLNKSIDLRGKLMPPIFDQGDRGSCVAESVVASYWYQYNYMFDGIYYPNSKEFSRRFIYYLARFLGDGKINEDKGCCIRNACKATLKHGVSTTLNDDDNLPFNITPNFYAMASAADERIDAYYEIDKNDITQYLTCLDNNIPIIISTKTQHFSDAARDGLSSKCLSWDKPIGHSHAMLIVGRLVDFDYFGEKRNVFVIRNSWGEDWGDKGYCYLPEDLMMKYGIHEARVIVKNNMFDYAENNHYKTLKLGRCKTIPNNSIIYKNKGYSRTYLNNLYLKNKKEYDNIFGDINDNLDILYIKNEDGEWVNIRKDKIKPDIKFPMDYINEFGIEYTFE